MLTEPIYRCPQCGATEERLERVVRSDRRSPSVASSVEAFKCLSCGVDFAFSVPPGASAGAEQREA